MHIVSIGSSASISQVTPAMMEVDNYYVVELPGYDNESGEETTGRDFVWFHMDTPPGQHKPLKVCKFCSMQKTLTFGQMPGAKFFGPITLTVDTTGTDMIRTPEQEKSHDVMGDILRAAQRRQAQ